VINLAVVVIERGKSVLPTIYTMLSKLLTLRLTPCVEKVIGDYQCGFQYNRTTINQIFCIRQTLKKMGL
jgi:hypothetical protein